MDRSDQGGRLGGPISPLVWTVGLRSDGLHALVQLGGAAGPRGATGSSQGQVRVGATVQGI